MLITLRNSGADGIHFYKFIEPHEIFKMLIIEDEKQRDMVENVFLKPIDVDSFIINKNQKINNLLLTNKRRNGKDFFEIILETGYGRYRLWYNDSRPDFYKRLFKYYYPEEAEKQIEELV